MASTGAVCDLCGTPLSGHKDVCPGDQPNAAYPRGLSSQELSELKLDPVLLDLKVEGPSASTVATGAVTTTGAATPVVRTLALPLSAPVSVAPRRLRPKPFIGFEIETSIHIHYMEETLPAASQLLKAGDAKAEYPSASYDRQVKIFYKYDRAAWDLVIDEDPPMPGAKDLSGAPLKRKAHMEFNTKPFAGTERALCIRAIRDIALLCGAIKHYSLEKAGSFGSKYSSGCQRMYIPLRRFRSSLLTKPKLATYLTKFQHDASTFDPQLLKTLNCAVWIENCNKNALAQARPLAESKVPADLALIRINGSAEGAMFEVSGSPQATVDVPIEHMMSFLRLLAVDPNPLGHQLFKRDSDAGELGRVIARATAIDGITPSQKAFVALVGFYVNNASRFGKSDKLKYAKAAYPIHNRSRFADWFTAIRDEAFAANLAAYVATASGCAIDGTKMLLPPVPNGNPTRASWIASLARGHDKLKLADGSYPLKNGRIVVELRGMGSYPRGRWMDMILTVYDWYNDWFNTLASAPESSGAASVTPPSAGPPPPPATSSVTDTSGQTAGPSDTKSGSGSSVVPPPPRDGAADNRVLGVAANAQRIRRVECLAQVANTCGQRAAYNARMFLQHAAGADDSAASNSMVQIDALHGIGPMTPNINEGAVQGLLGGAHIPVISQMGHFTESIDRKELQDAELAPLHAFRSSIGAARVQAVLNTAANNPMYAVDHKAAIDANHHWIAVEVIRSSDGTISARYADSVDHYQGSDEYLVNEFMSQLGRR